MDKVWIIGMIAAAAAAIITALILKHRKKKKSSLPTPRLHTRSPFHTSHNHRIPAGTPLPKIPPQRGVPAPGNGPGGISPYDFPCCPICKLRNKKGSAQVIFWKGNHYQCESNHIFQKNGRL